MNIIHAGRAIEDLRARVQVLEDRLAAQEGPKLPPECREQRCSYYRYYLALGPAEMPHTSYHYAEERLADAQDLARQWQKEHPQNCPLGERLCYHLNPHEPAARKWEARVRV